MSGETSTAWLQPLIASGKGWWSCLEGLGRTLDSGLSVIVSLCFLLCLRVRLRACLPLALRAVLLKGGHLKGECDAVDVFIDGAAAARRTSRVLSSCGQ